MIIQQWILVDPATGRIVGHIAGNGSVDMSPEHHAGLELYESERLDSDTYYFKNGEFELRPECPVQLAYTPAPNVVMLKGIPSGSQIKLRSVSGEHIVDVVDPNGELRLEFPTAGRYEITWDRFPYRSFRAVVEV